MDTTRTRHRMSLPSGVTLEGVLTPASIQPSGAKLAVCIHPWSRLGGSMNDPCVFDRSRTAFELTTCVLHTLTESLERLNYHVLRFNCRGVGRSTGWASFTGLTEGKDLEDVTAWALQTVPDVRSLVVIGYSYGSLIASLHPLLPTVKTMHILLSYPLGVRGLLTLFHASTYADALKGLIDDPSARILVIYGDQDEFTGIANYEGWTKELEGMDDGRGRLNVAKVEGATHFWHGRAWRELVRIVEEWVP